MKRILIIFYIFVPLLSNNFAFADFIWERQEFGIADADMKTIAVDPLDSDIVYLGTDKGIFKSTDGAETWVEILGYPVRSVNFIAVDKNNTKRIYAATDSGLFKSENAGGRWRRLSGLLKQGEKINYILISNSRSDTVYCATEKGLFSSANQLESLDFLFDRNVNFIAEHPQDGNVIFIATEDEIYKSENQGANWKKVLSLSLAGKEQDQVSDEAEDSQEELTDEFIVVSDKINCIVFDLFDTGTVYIGTQRGIYAGTNGGSFWERFNENGLADLNVRDILIAPGNPDLIFAATEKGVFEFSKKANRWNWLYKGTASKNFRDIAYDSNNNRLWAVSEKEIYAASLNKVAELPLNENYKKEQYYYSAYFSHEPTIIEVQNAAVEYAEVYPEKIISWRKKAKYRALLPDVSVSYDKTISYTKSDFWIGPFDWGVDFRWDLADLVWNPSQKDIDVRSRLMVELRNDILNEITRIYFERRRHQIELISSPPAELNKRMDKELRIMELTAVLDAYTGGYFTKNIKNNND